MDLAILVFDRLRAFDFAGGKNDARRPNRHSFSFMRLIYRQFFNASDRINCISKARRAMWKSGIRRKIGFLAAAALLDHALQLEVPVILVRRLTTQEFGD
jgi:hypothetical protein